MDYCRLGYQWNRPDDLLAFPVDCPCNEDIIAGNVCISPHGERLLRKVLGIPTLTPEQVAVAEAEAVLERARLEGLLLRVEHYSPGNFNQPTNATKHSYLLYMPHDVPHLFEGATRLAAAQAAADRCHELRAEAAKPKLPDPEEMDGDSVQAALLTLGWEPVVDNSSGWASLSWINVERDVKVSFGQGDVLETPAKFARRALREARALDAQGGPS